MKTLTLLLALVILVVGCSVDPNDYESKGKINADLKYTLKYAKAGNVAAQLSAATYYFSSENKDPVKSGYWYAKAAEQGDFNGLLNAGLAYCRGDANKYAHTLLPLDRDKGLDYLWRAFMEGGEKIAPIFIARCYPKNDHFNKLVWYTVAENLGVEGAKNMVYAETLSAYPASLGGSTRIEAYTISKAFRELYPE